MFKPGNTDYQAIAAARAHASNANNLQQEVYRLNDIIDDLVAENRRLKNKVGRLEAVVEMAEENALATREATEGNTVTGYTNNPATDLLVYGQELVKKYTRSNVNMPSYTLPWGTLPDKDAVYDGLTLESIKGINLRLLCRAEWIDYCRHSMDMARFGFHVIMAFLKPSESNAHIRNKKLLNFYAYNAQQYFKTIDKAMNPETGEEARAEFEQKRYVFWQKHVRYGISKAQKRPYPSEKAIRSAFPDLCLNRYLVGAMIANVYGVHIGTGEKATEYRKEGAGLMPSGVLSGVVNSGFVK
ncbi:MAG: hypothetical protein K6L60_01170 [Oceanobacter sp.]